jgi:hypothetical protein
MPIEGCVFRYSRRATAIYLVGSIILAVLSLSIAGGPSDAVYHAKWISAAFTLSSVAFFWLLLRPLTLLLDADGLTLHGGFRCRPERLLWRDVGEFYLQGTGRGATAIAYKLPRSQRDYGRLADEAPRQRKIKVLPDGWDQPQEDIVAMLNSYRQAALQSVPFHTPPAVPLLFDQGH